MNEAELYKSVGAMIGMRRRELKKTQDEVATAVGISRASLANIETGRQKILLHYLYRLVGALDLPGIEALLPAQGVKPDTVSAKELEISGEELNRKQEAEVRAFVANISARARRRGDKNA